MARLGVECQEVSGGCFQGMWRQDEVVILKVLDAHRLQAGTYPGRDLVRKNINDQKPWKETERTTKAHVFHPQRMVVGFGGLLHGKSPHPRQDHGGH